MVCTMMNRYDAPRGCRAGRAGRCAGRSPEGYDAAQRRPGTRMGGDRGIYPFGRMSGGCGGMTLPCAPKPSPCNPAVNGNGCGCQGAPERPSSGGCGCSGGQKPVPVEPRRASCVSPVAEGGGEVGTRPEVACAKLTEQLRAVDFALYEVILYLDAYPHSCDALETYHKLKAQREALHREYEATCGPITAFGNRSTTGWDWMSKPFPWEYNAD